MSSSPLVLITGGNGFIGYAVLAGALEAGVRDALSKQNHCRVIHLSAYACFYPTPERVPPS